MGKISRGCGRKRRGKDRGMRVRKKKDNKILMGLVKLIVAMTFVMMMVKMMMMMMMKFKSLVSLPNTQPGSLSFCSWSLPLLVAQGQVQMHEIDP